MKHVYNVNIYISNLHFSITVGTIGTSPKIYKKGTCVYYEISQILWIYPLKSYYMELKIFIHTFPKMTLHGNENIWKW